MSNIILCIAYICLLHISKVNLFSCTILLLNLIVCMSFFPTQRLEVAVCVYSGVSYLILLELAM